MNVPTLKICISTPILDNKSLKNTVEMFIPVSARMIKEVIDGEERTVDNYQKFVNPVVKYAYIKTQTNFGDSKIDISQDGAVLGSGNGEADATAFMSSDNIVLPVKVTAKDGATMNYKLFIEKASNNIALKIVEAKVQVAGTMMLTPVTATPARSSMSGPWACMNAASLRLRSSGTRSISPSPCAAACRSRA